MTETEHKNKLSELGERVMNSKNLQELWTNLNAYEIAHQYARRAYPTLTVSSRVSSTWKTFPRSGAQLPQLTKTHFPGMKIKFWFCPQAMASMTWRIGKKASSICPAEVFMRLRGSEAYLTD